MAYGAYAGNSANPGGGMDAMTDGPVEKVAPPKEGEMSEHETGILPKAILGGKQFAVGDEVVLKITRIGEKDVEVAYSNGGDKDEKQESGGGGDGATPVDRSTTEMGAGLGSMLE